jgi:protein phosphatase
MSTPFVPSKKMAVRCLGGDSRLYLIRNGKALRLTTDHTWVQEAVEKGLITPDQARDHPNAHVLRRHLGSQIGVEPDFRLRMDPSQNNGQAVANQGMRLLPGDQLLLCSDGLTDLVEDEEIEAYLRGKSVHESYQADRPGIRRAGS